MLILKGKGNGFLRVHSPARLKDHVDFLIGACFENYYRYIFFYPAGSWVQGFSLIPSKYRSAQLTCVGRAGQGPKGTQPREKRVVRQPGDSLSKTQVDVT